jgi:ketosteroid isomerase-like protein
MATNPESMTSHTSAQAVEALNRRWMESYIKRDLVFLEQHLSGDYVGTFPDGSVLDKRGEIEALRSGTVVLRAMTPREMTVHTYGDAAVITGRSTIAATVKGREESGEYRFTDVWINDSGRWLAVASHVTRIATDER